MPATPDVPAGPAADELRQQLAAALAERDSAQAQQAALAEVLRAINASTGNLTPVFEMILERAMTLCDAPSGGMLTVDNDHATAIAFRNSPQALLDYWSTPQYIAPATSLGQVLRQGKTLHH